MQAIVVVLLVVLCAAVHAVDPLGEWRPGRATYYNGIDGGNCGFGAVPTDSYPNGHIAALNEAWYDEGANCGTCWEVRCVSDLNGDTTKCITSETVIVTVTDNCPVDDNPEWCSGDKEHTDLSLSAFTTLAEQVTGVILTEHRRVNCPVTENEDILVQFHVDSHEWWFAFYVKRVGGTGSISEVWIQGSNMGTPQALSRQEGGYLWDYSGQVEAPVWIKFVQEGEEVEGEISGRGAGQEYSTGAQFSVTYTPPADGGDGADGDDGDDGTATDGGDGGDGGTASQLIPFLLAFLF
ncbi:Streptogramin lyase [Balamuthia mandrillaris]